MISFEQIPITLLTPGNFVEFDTSQMQSGLPVAKTRTLIVGQKLAAGSAPANTPVRVLSVNHAKTLFGQGSMLAGMFEGYFANDTTTEVWGMGLADAEAGVAATQTITLAGAATAAGTLEMMVTDMRVRVPVASGDTSAEVATALGAAINALLDLPVTASVNASVVTVTARHKGAESNGLFIRANYHAGDALPPGLTAPAIAAGTAGATNPDASAVFTALGEMPFQTIVHPWNDDANMDIIEAALADRANALKMNYGEAFTHNPGTFGALTTAAALRNSPYNPVTGMFGIPSAPWKVAAAVAAQVTFSLKQDPGRPFNTLVLKGILPPVPNARFTRTERELLLETGIATLVVNANEEVAIERMVTTYKTNPQGFADTGLRDLNAILLLYYLSWSQQARISMRFPRYKLADDGTNYAPGQKVVTPKVIRAELVALAREWEQAGLIENVDQYIADLKVERDATDRDRVNSFQRPDLINGFQVLASLIQPIA